MRREATTIRPRRTTAAGSGGLAFGGLDVLEFLPLWGNGGITMLRFRLAFGLFAAALLLSTVASAWAFSLQSVGSGGAGNSTFTDPDEQLTDSAKSVRPFGSNGPTMQFDVQQQGTLTTPFGGGNRYNNAAPDPYYGTLRNGN